IPSFTRQETVSFSARSGFAAETESAGAAARAEVFFVLKKGSPSLPPRPRRPRSGKIVIWHNGLRGGGQSEKQRCRDQPSSRPETLQFQTSRAVSTASSSFRHCSSSA